MTTAARDAQSIDAHELLTALLVPEPAPFALLRRMTPDGPRVEVLTGAVTELAELPLSTTDGQVLAIIPFRQVVERGYDHEPILALVAEQHAELSISDTLDLLPDVAVELAGGGFDLSDEEYEKVVQQIIDGEIRTGEGSNFVIRRSFQAKLAGYRPEVAMTIFRRLLTMEGNAYWTFLVHTGERTFVGTSPEQHVQVADGVARMKPISGTYRYPETGPDLAGVLGFLADQKETDELFMLVDEGLKMLGRVCDTGARVRGPYLREQARHARTEYLLEGPSSMDVRDVLRETMFAPTVALVGRDTMDSAIMTRAAEIRQDGSLRIDVSATLVRDSQPAAEVAETWAKVSALLSATGLAGSPAPPANRVTASIAGDLEVLTALERRNLGLSSFWLARGTLDLGATAELAGRVLIVDAEDMFTDMLGHQLRSFGLDCAIRSWRSVRRADLDGFDLIVLGPGPGDPRDLTDPKIARLRDLTRYVVHRGIPLVGECLSHQILCDLLGLELFRRDRPNQGTRRGIDLFGRSEPVGFYNSYAARHTGGRLISSRLTRGTVEICRDRRTGEVHAVRGGRFAATQFHLESVLTKRGTEILAELVAWVVGRGASRRRSSA